MNNEPVAYITMSGLSYQQTGLNDRPLFTHPVDAVNTSKQYVDKSENNRHDLTDDEIVWLWVDCEKDGTSATYIKFARALLKKAQEK